MITIYICSGDAEELKMFGDYTNGILPLSNRRQWRYIKDINKVDGCIATTAHRESILRKYFINPHLDNNGYMKEFGEYKLEFYNHFTIQYRLALKGCITEDKYMERSRKYLNNK